MCLYRYQWLLGWLILWMLLGITGCQQADDTYTEDGRLVLNYWEKWSGFEAQAMQDIVDDYNRSQDNVRVKMLSVSQIDQKMLLATAGGNPPDIAGLWSHTINIYAEKNALTPLDDLLAEKHITADHYVPVFWELCSHRGLMWGLPTTPATLGLYWNKKLFEKAGLDPDKPPKTIEELDRMAEQLTVVRVMRQGKEHVVRYPELTDTEKKQHLFEILQLGFSPFEPGWWNEMWCYWFDGKLWDHDQRITPNCPENQQAYRWLASYPEKYGVENLLAFGSSFGNFASPQSSFFSERVAMVLQGVWNFNFIGQYAPNLQWAAAAFPSIDASESAPVTIVECDVLVIPHGARHVREAFDFLRYVSQQKVIEKLALGQRKFTPLRDVSDTFYQSHPNPYIKVFARLAQSPHARYVPRISIWQEYKDEMNVAIGKLYRLQVTPDQAMKDVRQRMQKEFDRQQRHWQSIATLRQAYWREMMTHDQP